MNRTYSNYTGTDASYFIGTEVEKTKFYGVKTLFVVGLSSINNIEQYTLANQIHHVYIGANKSFNNRLPHLWKFMIEDLIDKNYLVTFDFNVRYIKEILLMELPQHGNLIFNISVELPYLNVIKNNSYIKFDDIGFHKTNEGVWVLNLSELLTDSNKTGWDQYEEDKVV